MCLLTLVKKICYKDLFVIFDPEIDIFL